jgi:hypothetical protein
VRKLPTKSQLMSKDDQPVDGSQGDKHLNKPSSDSLLDPKAKPSKIGKSSNSSSSKDMSPIRQIMKAVTDHALNPKKKKVAKNVKTKGEAHPPGARASSATQSAKGKAVKDDDGDMD